MLLKYSILLMCCGFGLCDNTAIVSVSGDVTVIGMFAAWSSRDGVCSSDVDINSVMLIEAVKWYINQLNQYGKLPLTIGFEAYATCGLSSRAADVTVDILRRRHNETFLGIIGPEYSSEAVAISPILTSVSDDRKLLQVGFSSTAASLKDRSKYPDYIRVIPNDDYQIETMIQTMTQLEWNRITIVYENDIYGKECAESLAASAEEEDVCISNSIGVRSDITPEEITIILNDIMYGTQDRPTNNGIVVFASPVIVSKLFLSMESSGLSYVPIVLMSESLDMDVNTLKQTSGINLVKSHGSLAVSPPYRDVVEFSEHWKKIFTSSSSFDDEFKTNPLLVEVHRALSNSCPFNKCEELPEAEVDGRFGTQPLFVQYVLIAAHALIKGMTSEHQKLCSPGEGFCSNLKDNLPLTDLKGLELDFDTDFDWRSQSMSETMSFDANGELSQPRGQPWYQVFNYKKTVEETFDLVKVGDFSTSDLVLNHDELRDYGGDGQEYSWPNLRKAQCPIKMRCEDCIQMKADSVLYEPGDYYVIAAVPVFDSDGLRGCGSIRTYPGYQVIEAIKKAIEEMNAQSAVESKDLKIGLIVLNTCNNGAFIQRKIHELHHSGVRLPNGTTIVMDENKVIGYIGEINSHISIAMAEVLSYYPLIQISYASTTDKLSDRVSYPNFMRIVSPIKHQGEAMVNIVKYLNSNYVQIIYSDTVYGRNGKDEVVKAAADNQVCVVQSLPFRDGDNPYGVYDKLRQHPHARIVIVFLHSYLIRDFMSAVVSKINQGEFVFIGSQTWHHTDDLLHSDYDEVLLGSYSLGFEIGGDSQLLQRIRNLTPRPYRLDPWSMPFLQARGDCYYDSSYDKTQPVHCNSVDKQSFDLDYLDSSAYFTTKALLKGATSFLHKQCSLSKLSSCMSFGQNRQEFKEELHRVKLDIDGSGTEDYAFDDNGDGNIGLRIYNVQKDKFEPTKMVYTSVGRYSRTGKFVLDKDKVVYPTNGPFSSVCPNAQTCKMCNMTSEEVKDDGDEKSALDTSIILGIVLSVVVVVAVILVAVMIIALKKNRDLQLLIDDKAHGYINPVHIERDIEMTPPAPDPHGLIQTTDN